MRIIQEKNIEELANCQTKAVLEGYDVCLAGGFSDSNGVPRPDCPIYIDLNDNGKCIVGITEDIKKWKTEAIKYIRESLPFIKNPICRYVSPRCIPQHLRSSFVLELSQEVYDREGNVMVDVLAFNRKPSNTIIEQLEEADIEIPIIEILVEECRDNSYLQGVMDVIISKGRRKFNGTSMWYKSKENDYTVELGFLQTEAGISIRKID